MELKLKSIYELEDEFKTWGVIWSLKTFFPDEEEGEKKEGWGGGGCKGMKKKAHKEGGTGVDGSLASRLIVVYSHSRALHCTPLKCLLIVNKRK